MHSGPDSASVGVRTLGGFVSQVVLEGAPEILRGGPDLKFEDRPLVIGDAALC